MINDMAPSLSCHFLYFLEQIGSPVCQKDVTATCKKKYYASQRGFGSHINKEKHFLVPVEYPSYFPLDIDSMDDRLEGKLIVCTYLIRTTVDNALQTTRSHLHILFSVQRQLVSAHPPFPLLLLVYWTTRSGQHRCL